LGAEATQFPDPPEVEALESDSLVLALVPSEGGGSDAVIDLTADLTALEESPRPSRKGLLRAAPWQLVLKRGIDVVGSLLLLVILLPILLVTALAVLLSSSGSILYVHERVGRDGRPFRMLKFRSMRKEAEDERGDILHLNQAVGPVFKIPDDPRMTRVGRVIRKLSIDELPQLVNVLAGDMSLVGPRPPLPEEYATYDAGQRHRLSVTPGLTCIWQVSGRSDLDFETWVEMDLEYIESWNLRKDLAILLQTVPAVLSGRGAY
jgi:lipopolysaccharide/colanic/teichoic acid biosynthesis glycosyltransferase